MWCNSSCSEKVLKSLLISLVETPVITGLQVQSASHIQTVNISRYSRRPVSILLPTLQTLPRSCYGQMKTPSASSIRDEEVGFLMSCIYGGVQRNWMEAERVVHLIWCNPPPVIICLAAVKTRHWWLVNFTCMIRKVETMCSMLQHLVLVGWSAVIHLHWRLICSRLKQVALVSNSNWCLFRKIYI